MEAIDLKTATQNFVIEGSTSSFKRDVIDASQKRPVLVDFYAHWCGPCKQLTPMLEKLVADQKGAISLVKIDVDQNKQLAAQLQIQSLPTVYGFVRGEPVDAFMGVLSAGELQQFTARLVSAFSEDPTPDSYQLARQQLQLGNVAGAALIYQQILAQAPNDPQALAGLCQCYLGSKDVARAQETFAKIEPKHHRLPEIAAVKSALELAATSSGKSLAELQKKLDADPKNMQARFDLAMAFYGEGRIEDAIESLLAAIKQDRKWNDEAARAQLIKIFDTLGFDHPLAVTGRKKLSTILFS